MIDRLGIAEAVADRSETAAKVLADQLVGHTEAALVVGQSPDLDLVAAVVDRPAVAGRTVAAASP